MGTPVKQSVRLMIRALQMFAKKKKKMPKIRQMESKNIRTRDMTKHEKTFDTKWRMGNAEIRLRELLGHNYRN